MVSTGTQPRVGAVSLLHHSWRVPPFMTTTNGCAQTVSSKQVIISNYLFELLDRYLQVIRPTAPILLHKCVQIDNLVITSINVQFCSYIF